jgi:hypothetical protein
MEDSMSKEQHELEQLELIKEDWGNAVTGVEIVAGPMFDTWAKDTPIYLYHVTFRPSGKRPYRRELPTAPFSFPPNAANPVDHNGIAQMFTDALRIHEIRSASNRSPATIRNNGWEENPNQPWEI